MRYRRTGAPSRHRTGANAGLAAGDVRFPAWRRGRSVLCWVVDGRAKPRAAPATTGAHALSVRLPRYRLTFARRCRFRDVASPLSSHRRARRVTRPTYSPGNVFTFVTLRWTLSPPRRSWCDSRADVQTRLG